MPASTVKFFGRIPAARWAPLLLAAAIGACSSNNSSTGGTAVNLTLVSGGGISATVGTAVGPIVVLVTDADSVPVPGVQVTFTVSTGGGVLTATSVATDAQGHALTSVTLGHTVGTITLTAAATGVVTPITFQETGVADAPAIIVALGGSGQSGPRGTQLSDPLTAGVTDQYGNPVSGVTVTWTTTGGQLSAASSRTNASGAAQVLFTLPAFTGISTITGSALIGNATKMVTFMATATN